MDNAATVPVDPDVYRAIQPYFCEEFGNPSSAHSVGRKAREAIEKARKQCAEALQCEPEQIFFTSGSTESNQWALKMMDEYLSFWEKDDPRTYSCLYTNDIEHKSMLNGDYNYTRLHLHPDKRGVIDWDKATRSIDPKDKVAIAIGWINSEIGTAQPIGEISDYCHEHNIPLHIDATQGVGKHPVNLKKWEGITTLSMSGHKCGATKGVGLLYIRNPRAKWVRPLIFGGKQEQNLRAGTENVPGIVGLGVAMEKISAKRRENWIHEGEYVRKMHDFLKEKISEISEVRFNGDCEFQFPHYLNVSFKGVLGEALALALDRRGICVSTGSACNTGSLTPSHVLRVIGVPEEYIDGTIRISLSGQNTMTECETVVEAIKEEVAKLRSVSPTWKGE